MVYVKKLSSYLRSFRKRSGLSQDELAFLFGAESGTVIWNYEQGRRLPGLRNLAAYEFVFQSGVRELFAGFYEETGLQIVKRAERLIRELEGEPINDVTRRKLRFLRVLVEPDAPWNQGALTP
jgi:transcriptional regulator with XRE-family HTH domain